MASLDDVWQLLFPIVLRDFFERDNRNDPIDLFGDTPDQILEPMELQMK
jgi:hypothetical protein